MKITIQRYIFNKGEETILSRKIHKSTIINISIITMTVSIILSSFIIGNAAGRFQSQGKIVFTNKTASGEDDVIFDAADFERLAKACK